MMEEWRTIPGYEGLYEVSNTGRVRSLDRYDSRNCFRKGKVLSPVKSNIGYLLVSLCCNGKYKGFTVHRLVAQAFIPNPDNLPEINHKDEDKTNNSVENLEWCDRKYNNNYGSRKDKVRDTKIKNGYWTGLSRKESLKKYYQENRDSYREYYEKNKEKKREYYEENREKIRENQKKWRENNKDYHKKWLEKHPGYMDKYKKE